MHILIAEDEKEIQDMLEIHLKSAGHSVTKTSDGLEALEVFAKEQFDLVILDVMMPRLNGFNTAQKIREISEVPIIFVTACGDDTDKVLGLGLGGDDYIVKPFSPLELIARVQVQGRKSKKAGQVHQEKITLGRFTLDNVGCFLYKDGVSISLNAKQMKIAALFMSNPRKVLTKKQVYQKVWEDEQFFDDNTVMVHISRIREKIEDEPQNPKHLITVWGVGYRFEV